MLMCPSFFAFPFATCCTVVKCRKGGKFPKANGAVHGQGVYSAIGPRTPVRANAPSSLLPHNQWCRSSNATIACYGRQMSYAKSGNNSVILAKALKGVHGKGTNGTGIDGLDSWHPKEDWMVFKDDTQVCIL